ncbi:MAG: NAD(P)/FAD-dependent oxidoreductase [Candidatus Magasanikbacteria bacterium]|nr:NAD(P)/FAD-dependent oxidoreductase [Candidatus Magasanikbacteria bacterium]
MSKKSSTGALTLEQRAAQDARYAEGHQYDYVIIGTGNAALTVAALLAKAGYKICMLEYHDAPGGYMQTFKTGEYSFCAQVHYTWGCGRGGKVYEFLKHIGLEKDITFELYDKDGYDHMVMPDGKTVKIPYDFKRLADNIDAVYPGQGKSVTKFCAILSKIRTELRFFPERKIRSYEYITKVLQFRTLLRYRHATLQDLFNECGVPKEAQAVLAANAGDFMEPPHRLSIFAYAGLFGGYNLGAYYPSKHFKYYVNRLADFITSHDGCHIYYETEVTKINTKGKEVASVETKDKKVFTAKQFICNMDPQTAAKKLIGWEKFPKAYQKKLQYEYSPSGMVIYLGLKPGFDLKQYRFGKFNTWHLQEWDLNKTWADQLAGNFDKCWWFMSTPTLHSNAPGTAPAGAHILEIATLADYDSFHTAQQENYLVYMKKKMQLAEHLLDLVEKNYIPDLRENIVVKSIGTSTTNEDYVLATRGNAYGSAMIPSQMAMGRLKAGTPWHNFFWCNASSGYAGMYGTVHTGISLYTRITGDAFYRAEKSPTDEEFIQALYKG